ncbi:putative atpase aaa+ type core protein [Fusarium flagelliforme]|uniref:Putative atpase aaa+ type core protein n=1 Tax=Fusarium flagelliforme TaxID=2675880 RepID=A0A395MWQ9_9HYPO|nr:putative atpase aaa+ type core protein [Fusarium flagelliforme]
MTNFTDNVLNEKQLLLCNSKVKAYPLQTKTWGEIEVDPITNIAWNDDVFANLVLPSGYKNLVTCFVEGQARHTSDFDDIIQGKGLGVVILFVGTPGTGKTLTAEAVADNTRKPLYILSAGELGNEAEQVEHRLNEVLRLAEKWDAVLLFDECDVFLQQRSMDHLRHNEIVAVFLRVIEYYRGILTLTTNRGNAIDGAFQSRIHLTLHYPDLDAPAREKVWRRFTIDNNAETSLSCQALKSLSQLPMNGRQIRNVVKISRILAGKEESRLGLKQIRTVLEATQQNNGMSLDVLGADETQD